jgi:hypothetical protein
MDRALPGDELLAQAPLVMDRSAGLPAPPERVWPWLLQLGKGRAGWYLPRSVERLVPRGHRAIRHIDPRFQHVSVGDRVPDYGPGGWFEARRVQPPHALVWWSERGRDLRLSWALVLEPVGSAASELLIRLRISRHIGRRAPALSERAGELVDLVTVRLMIAGLRERLRES